MKKEKKRRRWWWLVLILLFTLLLLMIPRVVVAPITAHDPPEPTPTPHGSTRSVVMKTRAQLMQEYGLTPPPLPTIRPNTITTMTPSSLQNNTLPTTSSQPAADFGGFFVAVGMFLLTLLTGGSAALAY
jgi:hypothetical protein